MYANVNGGYIETPPRKGWLSGIRKMFGTGSSPVISGIAFV
jgi:hypothetical protein